MHRLSAAICLDRTLSWLNFLPYYTCLFLASINLFPPNEVSLLLIAVQFFTLVCQHTLPMTTASSVPQTASNGPIATHFTISIISRLVTPNQVNRRFSYCLLHLQVFNPSNDFKIFPHNSQQ